MPSKRLSEPHLSMKKKLLVLTLALASSLALHAQAPANGQNPPPQGGPGGPGGGFHVLPRGAKEKLKLTDDQQKQISDLEAEVKSKIEKILTPEQAEQLKQMRPPGRGQGGPGGGQGGQGAGKRPSQQPPQQTN
jgi:Spy/CpxP family protein refolding chaperone